MTTDTTNKEAGALKPCPMCDGSLSEATASGYHHHPANGCIFSGFELSRDDVAAWNRRALLSASKPAEHQDSRYIVIGYGESDYPQASFANDQDELLDAVLGMIYTRPSDACDDTREEYRRDLADEDEWCGKVWRTEFEIGGIVVYDTGASAARAAPAQSGDDVRERIARALHYPPCWDTAAYPTLESAMLESLGDFMCTTCLDKSAAPQPSPTAVALDDERAALRDMLEDARAETAMIREALGVPYEPHQTLLERTLDAARAASTQPVVLDERAAFEWPPLPAFPESFAHVAGHAYFTEHQMQGYANAYGKLVRAVSPQPVEQIGKNALVLTGAQLLEALDFIAPDRATDAEQLESEVAIEYGEGHAGKAMYCWCADYPEEGSWVLDGKSATVAQPVEQTRALTDDARAVITMLINLARATYHALDNSEECTGDDGRFHAIGGPEFDEMSDALDALEELPDDRPGYTLAAPGKAEWALRALLTAARPASGGA